MKILYKLKPPPAPATNAINLRMFFSSIKKSVQNLFFLIQIKYKKPRVKFLFIIYVMKNLSIIELNEFSPEVIKTCANKFNCKNILKLLEGNYSKTVCDTKDNNINLLEPWIQWVSHS